MASPWPIPRRPVEFRIPAENVTLQIPFAFTGTNTSPKKPLTVSIPFDVSSIDVRFSWGSSSAPTAPSAILLGPFIPELGASLGVPLVGIPSGITDQPLRVSLPVPRTFQGESLTLQILRVLTTDTSASPYGQWSFGALSGSASDLFYGCVTLTFNRALNGVFKD